MFNSSVGTLTRGPQDHSANLACRVAFPGAEVSAERTMQLHVCECSARTLGLRVRMGQGPGGGDLGSVLGRMAGEKVREHPDLPPCA